MKLDRREEANEPSTACAGCLGARSGTVSLAAETSPRQAYGVPYGGRAPGVQGRKGLLFRVGAVYINRLSFASRFHFGRGLFPKKFQKSFVARHVLRVLRGRKKGNHHARKIRNWRGFLTGWDPIPLFPEADFQKKRAIPLFPICLGGANRTETADSKPQDSWRSFPKNRANGGGRRYATAWQRERKGSPTGSSCQPFAANDPGDGLFLQLEASAVQPVAHIVLKIKLPQSF